MATARQIAANQRNAQKSTGPRTPEGKARSARNSTTHGLRSAQLCLLASEDPAEYAAFAEPFHLHYAPQTPPEHRYLAQLISAAWKLDRLNRMEAGLFEEATAELHERYPESAPASSELRYQPERAGQVLHVALHSSTHATAWDRYVRYQQVLERSFARAEAALNRLSKLPLAEREAAEPNEATGLIAQPDETNPIPPAVNEDQPKPNQTNPIPPPLPRNATPSGSLPATRYPLPSQPNEPIAAPSSGSLPATHYPLLPPHKQTQSGQDAA